MDLRWYVNFICFNLQYIHFCADEARLYHLCTTFPRKRHLRRLQYLPYHPMDMGTGEYKFWGRKTDPMKGEH